MSNLSVTIRVFNNHQDVMGRLINIYYILRYGQICSVNLYVGLILLTCVYVGV